MLYQVTNRVTANVENEEDGVRDWAAGYDIFGVQLNRYYAHLQANNPAIMPNSSHVW